MSCRFLSLCSFPPLFWTSNTELKSYCEFSQRRVCIKVCVSPCGLMGGWGPSLKPCGLLFRWNSTQVTVWDHTPLKPHSQTWECQRMAIEGRNEWREHVCWRGGGRVKGTDGIGATEAEPLPLIAALDKESIWKAIRVVACEDLKFFGALWIGPSLHLFTYLSERWWDFDSSWGMMRLR